MSRKTELAKNTAILTVGKLCTQCISFFLLPLAMIGRKYSTWLYIIHPIFITVLSIVVGKLGLKSIYRYVAPIVVYCATLVFLIILQKVKIAMKSK